MMTIISGALRQCNTNTHPTSKHTRCPVVKRCDCAVVVPNVLDMVSKTIEHTDRQQHLCSNRQNLMQM